MLGLPALLCAVLAVLGVSLWVIGIVPREFWSTVKALVFGLVPKHNKVLRAIVALLAIDVVDTLARIKATSYRLLCNQAMLKHVAVGIRRWVGRFVHVDVSRLVLVAAALPSRGCRPSLASRLMAWDEKDWLAGHLSTFAPSLIRQWRPLATSALAQTGRVGRDVSALSRLVHRLGFWRARPMASQESLTGRWRLVAAT